MELRASSLGEKFDSFLGRFSEEIDGGDLQKVNCDLSSMITPAFSDP